MFFESIKMSWVNIVHNKMRSFLTILGIVIGVASIIALITIVQGATNYVTKQISDIGADRMTVNAMGTPLKQGITVSELDKIIEIDNVAGVSPTISGQSAVVYNREVIDKVSIQGKNEVYFQREKDVLKMGRGLNILDIESQNKVAIIGQEITDTFFFGKNPLGEKILVSGVAYTVVGVYEPSSALALNASSKSVIMPYTTAMRSLGVKNITNFDVYMADSTQGEQIKQDVEGVLNAAFNYNEDGFSIINFEDILDMFGNLTGILSAMLAGIASISLVVGGIGIMNMMLVSVTERTTEIGLRKALGAEPNVIQQQFLLEAIFLSLFGGFIGLGLGVLISLIATSLMGLTFSMTTGTILLAIGFSSGVGVVFGWAPARKASRLNPIDALRSV